MSRSRYGYLTVVLPIMAVVGGLLMASILPPPGPASAVSSPSSLPPAVAPTPMTGAPTPDCQFTLGFLTLAQMIPDIVGQCFDEQSYSAEGDGIQHTISDTGALGLLVWRKSDNFTAFTDGYRTWVNGPFGLQERLNSQRFFWEWNPEQLPIVPTPSNGGRCHTAYLSLAAGQGNAGAGHQGLTWIFTNNTSVSCTFFGYVGAQMLDAFNNPIPTNVVRGGFLAGIDPGPSLVAVPPGGTATFEMEWGVVPTGDETACPQASRLLVTPPDELASLIVPTQMAPCNSGTINVTAVQASS